MLANLGLEVLPKSPHQRANLGKKLGPNPEKMRGKYEEMFEKSSKLEANHHHLTFSTFLAVSGEKSVAIDADLMISHSLFWQSVARCSDRSCLVPEARL